MAVDARHVSAQSPGHDEYLVKAAFLYSFAKFVEWPPQVFMTADTPITLCIYGTDPFGDALKSIRGKSVKSRALMIKRAARGENLEACHILFISASEQVRLSQLIRHLNGSHVLTIGDMDRFAHAGGIINLVKVQNKVRFEINLDAAQRAGLKISSQLLKLATLVNNR